MLSNENKDQSFRNVKDFVEKLGGCADSFQGVFDVMVETDTPYLYRDVIVHTSYNYGYMDYQIDIIWEDDKNQVSYKDINLHGTYSSNFQLFLHTNKNLSFLDGNCKITILPK